ADEVEDDTPEGEALHEKLFQWFGSAKKGPDEKIMQAGELIFFDAIPLQPVQLHTEVMTPHMGKWYEQGGDIEGEDILEHPERIPADWHDPNPIFFLVVDKPIFLFSVALRNPAIRSCNLGEVLQALELSLKWLGAGAKTATGYGRMERDDNHVFLRGDLPMEEQVRRFVATWDIETIPTKIGKKYNPTRKSLCDQYGAMAWDIAIKHLWQLHGEEISSWEGEDKKTTKGKAFKRLTQDK
ncbi:MAG: type III-B CRISPR module RAMP protein Cmr6, partial [Candidatus Electrothrix sp. AR3]|nr:type III-B CRISPR module RAMP protein Cmr6 [Candidatus Electrothrix sp. AR3]